MRRDRDNPDDRGFGDGAKRGLARALGLRVEDITEADITQAWERVKSDPSLAVLTRCHMSQNW